MKSLVLLLAARRLIERGLVPEERLDVRALFEHTPEQHHALSRGVGVPRQQPSVRECADLSRTAAHQGGRLLPSKERRQPLISTLQLLEVLPPLYLVALGLSE